MTREEKLKLVKEIPIQKYFDKIIIPNMGYYYDDRRVDFSFDPRCKCPLHSEDTPSFRYYDYSNTFYCFGCARGGDIVQLHRQFMEINMATKVTFWEAVDYLYNLFIAGRNVEVKGKKTNNAAKKKLVIDTDVGEPLSSNVELIIYFKYRNDLEHSLMVSDGLNEDKKMLLYDKMDILDKLINLNKINATAALNILKQYRLDLKPKKMLYTGVKK